MKKIILYLVAPFMIISITIGWFIIVIGSLIKSIGYLLWFDLNLSKKEIIQNFKGIKRF